MKWEDFSKQIPVKDLGFPRERVNVECPICGEKLWRRNDIILTSDPPQYRYECDCGWVGHAYH